MRRFIPLIAATLLVLAAAPTPQDGAHDFDFNFGTWHTHIKRLLHPLRHARDWVQYDGTVSVSKVLGGRANLEEIEADGPSHLEFANLRLYNPQSRQWSLNGASGGDNAIGPPSYGSFENGRGVFYDQEPFAGRAILVRQTFFGITGHSYDFEQAFSDDGGRTWEPNFVAHLTRLSSTAPSEATRSFSGAGAAHDFDFNYGTWSTRIRSRNQAANGATTWVTLTGRVAVRKIWNGRALMEEIKAGNASSTFEGVTLFLYNAQSHQWSQTYAGSDGSREPSMIGGFKAGRGELIGQGPSNGTVVLMRDAWSNVTRNAHHFEVAYSSDGGATWQPQFVADLTRIGPGL